MNSAQTDDTLAVELDLTKLLGFSRVSIASHDEGELIEALGDTFNKVGIVESSPLAKVGPEDLHGQ